jgi:hypothetical protein
MAILQVVRSHFEILGSDCRSRVMLAIVGVLGSYISSRNVNAAYAACVYVQRIAARTAPGPKQLGPIMSLAGLDDIVKCCIWTSRQS